MYTRKRIHTCNSSVRIENSVMPNSYPRDGTFDPHLTTIKDSDKTPYALYPLSRPNNGLNCSTTVQPLSRRSRLWTHTVVSYSGQFQCKSTCTQVGRFIPKVWPFCTQVLVVLYQRAGRFSPGLVISYARICFLF